MLSDENSKYTLFDQLINNNIRFAVYKLPFSQKITLILQKSEKSQQYEDISLLSSKKGYVISPFQQSVQYPTMLIIPEVEIHGQEDIWRYLQQLDLSHNIVMEDSQFVDEGINNFEQYKVIFDHFHQNIENQKLQKLVLSRTLDIDKPQYWSAGISFNKACKAYDQNYVYLCHTPETGTWFGCSPEVLLAGDKDEWKTDALAGTQKVATEEKQIAWDVKNSKEQAIVSDYIQHQLLNLGVESLQGEPKTIQSGDLIHIRSEFKFQLTDTAKVGQILDALHPTPAVCGYPKAEAYQFIKQNEHYQRAYYAGFIGSLDIDNRTNLYVNLRCMQILDNRLRLYAGGGIMPQSTAQSEWQETEYKLQTILSIL